MLSLDEFERALERIDALMANDPAPNTDDGRELMTLVDAVLEYELHHYPMLGPPTEARA